MHSFNNMRHLVKASSLYPHTVTNAYTKQMYDFCLKWITTSFDYTRLDVANRRRVKWWKNIAINMFANYLPCKLHSFSTLTLHIMLSSQFFSSSEVREMIRIWHYSTQEWFSCKVLWIMWNSNHFPHVPSFVYLPGFS